MEKLILFALLFLLPTQLAYHFWPQFSYIHGLRVDYLSPAIYMTDILVILLIPYLKNKLTAFLPIFIFALVNIFFAELPSVAVLRWLVIFKLYILGSYFYSCDLKKLRQVIVSAFTLSLITVSLIGLTQVILQKTVGGPLFYLGERSFTSQTPGISLVSIFGKSAMRAYSTFSHPNSFAGFVVVSFLILLSFKKQKNLYVVVVLSLLLTLSLNALIGVLVVGAIFLIDKNFPKFIRKIKQNLPALLISSSLLFGALSGEFTKNIFLEDTYKERIVLAGKAVEVFVKKPILGVGLNNYFYETKSVQPPHNVYLIVLSECGLVGVLILYFFLTKLLNRKLNKYLLVAIIFVLTTSLFDHYWFTLQQNGLILSVLLGLSIRNYTYKIDG